MMENKTPTVRSAAVLGSEVSAATCVASSDLFMTPPRYGRSNHDGARAEAALLAGGGLRSRGEWYRDTERRTGSLSPAPVEVVPAGIEVDCSGVVTVAAQGEPSSAIATAVDSLLCDRAGDADLVVRVKMGAMSAQMASWSDNRFEGNPRVSVAGARVVLEAYPTSPFQVTVQAVPGPPGLLARLRAAIRTAALGNGASATTTAAWAEHPARRTGAAPGDFGDVVRLTLRALGVARDRAAARGANTRARPAPGVPHEPAPQRPLGLCLHDASYVVVRHGDNAWLFRSPPNAAPSRNRRQSARRSRIEDVEPPRRLGQG